MEEALIKAWNVDANKRVVCDFNTTEAFPSVLDLKCVALLKFEPIFVSAAASRGSLAKNLQPTVNLSQNLLVILIAASSILFLVILLAAYLQILMERRTRYYTGVRRVNE
ncbi:hypothetical protein Q3G72_007147 [Acer saccharum]|nr:hypothetical protein Q3G72_007147 [Acer saccharum]